MAAITACGHARRRSRGKEAMPAGSSVRSYGYGANEENYARMSEDWIRAPQRSSPLCAATVTPNTATAILPATVTLNAATVLPSAATVILSAAKDLA